MKAVTFKQWICVINIGQYDNGNIALRLIEAGTEEPIAVATVNLNELLPYGYAHIKDYSENKGMLTALEKAGCIKRVVAISEIGYVTVPLVELNMKEVTK